MPDAQIEILLPNELFLKCLEQVHALDATSITSVAAMKSMPGRELWDFEDQVSNWIISTKKLHDENGGFRVENFKAFSEAVLSKSASADFVRMWRRLASCTGLARAAAVSRRTST